MLSKAAQNLSPLREPKKQPENSPYKQTAKTAADTAPTTKKTVRIEEPINTDEDVPSQTRERPSGVQVSHLVTELFRSIAIDETDVSATK